MAEKQAQADAQAAEATVEEVSLLGRGGLVALDRELIRKARARDSPVGPEHREAVAQDLHVAPGHQPNDGVFSVFSAMALTKQEFKREAEATGGTTAAQKDAAAVC